MGTRGAFGFRKNGVDKIMYNHWDSYPDYLGKVILEFCSSTKVDEINDMFDKIEMVDEYSKPSKEQITFCVDNNIYNSTVSNCSVDDWYCLLREEQGNLELIRDIIRKNNKAYMIDNASFLKDSLFANMLI